MPKTHSDDIAPTLPSSIDGPLQIIDPSDTASWIKIDPANARLAAAGDARPTRVLTTGYCRNYSSTTAHVIGTMAARYVTANNNGGFYLIPFRIPDDMDVAEPSNVKILVNPILNATTNGQVVHFVLAETHVAADGSRSTSTLYYNWDVPDDWTTSDHNVVLIDNGSGRTYDANTFANGEIVGFRISRNGIDASDTFDKSVKFAEYLQFEYTAKEY